MSVAGDTTNGRGLAFDAYVDDTLIGHNSCSCKDFGPSEITHYNTSALPDGSSHTLRVVLTETSTGAQLTQSWTFNIDRSPPVLSTEGQLRWPPNGYVDGSSHNLTLSAFDGLSGASWVWLLITPAGGGPYEGGGWTTNTECTPTDCDPDLSSDFTNITLPEGANLLTAWAYDKAGNSAHQELTVYVDKTGPRAPSVSAVRDPDTGEGFLVWGDAGDPAAPDGSPGSGTSSFRYRYSVGGGPWTAATDSDDLFASLGNVPAGTSVAVQVNAVDAVGNAGPATSTTLVVVDEESWVDSTFEGFDDTTSLQQTPSLQSRKRLVNCTVRTNPTPQPFVTELEGEPGVGIKGVIEGWCNPSTPTDAESVAAWENATLRISVCVQIEDGADWRNLKCDVAKLTGTSPNLHRAVSAAREGARRNPAAGVAVQRGRRVASDCRARPGYV